MKFNENFKNRKYKFSEEKKLYRLNSWEGTIGNV